MCLCMFLALISSAAILNSVKYLLDLSVFCKQEAQSSVSMEIGRKEER